MTFPATTEAHGAGAVRPGRADAARPSAWLSGFGWAAVALLALAAYLYGLDGRHIPKNGDESVYFHIARLTAASGHWLPLASELDNMRNTKPPMLFWQGIASTAGGEHWTRWNLRLPSVVYTFATALLAGLLARRLTGRSSPAWVAALSFLAFFSTFRYGRPFLTNAPETFWMFLPFFVLLYWRPAAFESRLAVPVLLGVCFGITFLYKSFALALPVGLGLAWWRLHHRDYRLAAFIRQDFLGLAITMAIALALFGLWFALDPEPGAIWREFVIGENAEKFEASGGYLRTLLWGSSSIWSLALNYPLNAGLLAVPVLAMFVLGLRDFRRAPLERQLLWLWVLTLFLVFALPSQRSGRYLFPAMPAIAVLLAVYWQRLPRGVYLVALLVAAAIGALIGYLSWRLAGALPAAALYTPSHWLVLLAMLATVVAGLGWRPATRAASIVAVFLTYLAFASTVAPLEGPAGRYDEAARRYAAGHDVWVPCNFRAMYEADRFLLPGANVLGYADDGGHDARSLAQRLRLFTVKVPFDGKPCEGCRVIGERLEIRSRHTRGQIDEMLRGRVFEHLFMRELLVDARPGEPLPGRLTPGTQSECR